MACIEKRKLLKALLYEKYNNYIFYMGIIFYR